MAWEELPSRAGRHSDRDPKAWYISVNSTGVRIMLPKRHDLNDKKKVRVLMGNGPDTGWMLIRPSEALGRNINKAKGGGAAYIHFSVLPRLDKDFRLQPVPLEAIDLQRGEVKVRLPWYENARPPAPISAAEAARPLRPPVSATVAEAASFAHRRRSAAPAGKPVVDKTARRAEDEAQIAEFLRTKGASTTLSIEQAAEYLRSKGEDLTIREGKKEMIDGVWYDNREPVHKGLPITIEVMYEMVNTYRKRADLPPVSVPEQRAA